jgi:hypothetical protein
LENRSKAKIRTIVWTFLVLLLFSVRIVVESVKESQGGLKARSGLLSTGQWLYSFHIDWSLFYFSQPKTSENIKPKVIVNKSSRRCRELYISLMSVL